MTREDIFKLADETFDAVLSDPHNSNAKIIAGVRDYDGPASLADYNFGSRIEGRVDDAIRAFKSE